jgi:VWFA-related protein
MIARPVPTAVLLALLLSSLPLAFPQAKKSLDANSTSRQQAAETPVIRSTTRLVQLSVIVQNRKGEPITGLKKEDFTILDQGKPQTVALFSNEGAPPPAGAPPRPLPLNVFTNRLDQKGQEPGAVTVILFDSLNTSVLDQSYVRNQILLFLKTLKPQDHVAIYGLTTQLVVLHEFTQDASALVAAVKQFRPLEMQAYDASHPADIDLVSLGADPQWARLEAALNNVNDEISQQRTIDRVAATTAAFEAIADHVAAIPGRKSLIWISGGFPISIGVGLVGAPDRDTIQFDTSNGRTGSRAAGGKGTVSGATQALNRVNMAIYPVDAKGVEIDSGMSPGMRGGSSSLNAAAFYMRQETHDSLNLLADRTGGIAYIGNNDIREAMRRAFDDGRYAYTIGFYPNLAVWDGKFRKIKIRVNAPGARLRYRQGYYAFPDRSDTVSQIKNELQEAALSPLEATSLGLSVTAKVIDSVDPSAARNLDLRMSLDPKQFLLQEEAGHEKGALDLLFIQLDSSNKIITAEKRHFALDFARKEYEFLAKAGLILEGHFTVVPQSSEIRVLIRDAGSGALGSVAIPAKAFSPEDSSSIPSQNNPN